MRTFLEVAFSFAGWSKLETTDCESVAQGTALKIRDEFSQTLLSTANGLQLESFSGKG